MQALRVDYAKVQHGKIVQQDDRMYVCSRDPKSLSTQHWLKVVRSHWAVENNNHHTLDTAFAEDDRPWIEADANGMLAVLLLRRIAYTLLALFRASLRTEENRAMPWRDLMEWLRVTLVAVTLEQTMNLRRRELCAAAR